MRSVIVIFSVFDRIKLLPYFLHYYSTVGATKFACGLYNGEKNPHFNSIASFKSRYNLSIHTSVISSFDKYRGAAEVPGLNKIRAAYSSEFDWYCIADLDEFHFFGGKTFQSVIDQAEKLGYEAIQGHFFDRVAIDGSFPDINGSLDETFPLGGNLSYCAGLSCEKIVLAKNNIPITAGHHTAEANTWTNFAEVHHFKWHHGVVDVVKDKYIRYKQQGLPWAIRELPCLIKLIENGVDLNNPELHLRYAAKLGI